MRDRAEIRAAYGRPGATIRGVARELGVARNTVRAALDPSRPDHYVRAPAGSIADEAEDELRELLASFPVISINAAMREIDWRRSRSVLAAKVKQLRPEFAHLPAVPGIRLGA